MNKTILAIGAHIGDMELTAGALLASCAVSGGHAVTLALTAGEKGAPAGADVAAYRQEKIAQAQAFMRDLGGEAIVLDHPDGLLPNNDTVRFEVCDIIRRVKPDIIVTHHACSMHKDHMACHAIVTDAWFYAAIAGFERELPPHFARTDFIAASFSQPRAAFASVRSRALRRTAAWHRACSALLYPLRSHERSLFRCGSGCLSVFSQCAERFVIFYCTTLSSDSPFIYPKPPAGALRFSPVRLPPRRFGSRNAALFAPLTSCTAPRKICQKPCGTL